MDKATLRRTACLWAVTVLLGVVHAMAASDIYVETAIDPSGQLHISTKHRKEIVPAKDREQTRFENAQISADGHAVGWLALYPSASTSYPLALKLVVLQDGKPRTYAGNGLIISAWCFWAEGKQVAFAQETLHGGMSLHYELRDTETGDLADKYDPDANPDSVTKPPRWVVALGPKE